REGHVQSPWEHLVGGIILGPLAEAQRVLKEIHGNWREQTPIRRMARTGRRSWEEMVKASEDLLGRDWAEITTAYGDWGRDGLLAVATRHLGWRLVELVREIPGLSYSAAAQGVRRFWRLAPYRRDMHFFAKAFCATMSIL